MVYTSGGAPTTGTELHGILQFGVGAVRLPGMQQSIGQLAPGLDLRRAE